MSNQLSKILYFLLVLIPYLILVGYSIAVYPDLPDELEHGFPRIIVFLPPFIATILPASFGVMIFFFSKYLRKAHYLTIAAFMDIGLVGLMFAVYFIKTS